jgi:hypothetical protein
VDTREAHALLRAELAVWRRKPYGELIALVGHARHTERRGESGAEYQLEMDVLWDDEPGGDIRVMGSIDDGGWRALAPLTESFILSKTGEFIGE